MSPTTIIIILLIVLLVQIDARLGQVTRELKELRKDLAKKPPAE
jgi:Sec-independent protein translocase protein TatA